MLNTIILQGRMVNDVDTRYTPTGVAFLTFTIAVERDFKDASGRKSDFVDVVAWRNTAEFVPKYFHKGDLILVSGRLQQRTYQTSEGQPRKTIEVLAEHVWFSESRKTPGTTSEEPAMGEFTEEDFGSYFGE